MFTALIYPERGLGTTKLSMAMATNDVTVNIMGGATHNNSK